jgi:hypothetical protein
MARHYSTRDFFRQMPNGLLARCFLTSTTSSANANSTDRSRGLAIIRTTTGFLPTNERPR